MGNEEQEGGAMFIDARPKCEVHGSSETMHFSSDNATFCLRCLIEKVGLEPLTKPV